MLLPAVGAEREPGPVLERLGDVDVEPAGVLLEHGCRDVLPAVVQRSRDLLRGRDDHQRLVRHQVERSQEAVGIDFPSVFGRELRRRRQLDAVGLAERPLGEDRETTYRLDLVAEQVDPDRLLLGRGVDVEDPATNGELAALLDLIGALVAGVGEQQGDVVEVDALASVERERLGPQLGVRDLLGQRDRAGDDDGARLGHRVHRRDPQSGQVRRRVEVGLERRPARRIDMDRAGREEGLQIPGEVAGGAVVGGHHQDRACRAIGLVSDQGGEQVGPHRPRHVGVGSSPGRRSAAPPGARGGARSARRSQEAV